MRTILAIAALLASIVASAAPAAVDVMRLDSIANAQFDDEQYVDVVKTRQQLIAGLKPGENDSLHAFSLVQIGRCLFKEQLVDSAVAVDKRALEIYSSKHGRDMNYAIIADNISYYLSELKQHDEAAKYSNMAVQVVNSVPEGDGFHKAYVLMHAAEHFDAVGNHLQAIMCENSALKLMQIIYGEHSDTYIDELEYLSMYYTHNGNTDKAAETDATIERLRKEAKEEYIDIPDATISNARDALLYSWAVPRVCKYFLDHYINSYKMNEAANFIIHWSDKSDEVRIVFASHVAHLMGDEKQAPVYMAAFIASCSKYALEQDEKDFTQEMYSNAIVDVLNYYNANSQYTGTIEAADTLIALYKKSPADFYAQIDKYYADDMAEAQSKQAPTP